MLVHKHLIVRAEVEKPIVDVEVAKDWLKRLITRIGMNLTEHGGPHCDYVNKAGNSGIAAVAIIETSHVGLHCWDQENPPFVQVDVYSCSEYNPKDVLRFIQEMSPTKVEYKYLDRDSGFKELFFENT